MTRWRAADVAWVDDGERAVVLPLSLDAPQTRLLSDSAAAIWRALVAAPNPLSSRQVAEEVAPLFGVAPDEVEADVDAFLESMAGEGIVSPSPDDGGSSL